jgi:hypothetical protein
VPADPPAEGGRRPCAFDVHPGCGVVHHRVGMVMPGKQEPL